MDKKAYRYYIYKILYQKMNITNIQTFSEFSELAQEAAVKRFPDGCVDFFSSFVDFTIDCSKIKICQLLAKGNEGSVYSGLLENENYAIKVEELHSGVQEQANLIVELTILQSLPHDRLVRFMGAGLSNTPVGSKVNSNPPIIECYSLIHLFIVAYNICLSVHNYNSTRGVLVIIHMIIIYNA